MRRSGLRMILIFSVAALTACGGKESTGTAPTSGGIRVGVWQGTLPSAPAGSGTLSLDRKSTRLNSSHIQKSRMPSSA